MFKISTFNLPYKKTFNASFVFLLFFIALVKIRAQGCFPQGIIFNTQAAIDEFKIVNPGCKIIEGDLVIGGYNTLIGKNQDIKNLNALNGIEEVKGKLIVSSIENLLNLTGLSQLKKVGGDIIIQGNGKINNLSGLEKLTGIEGNLEFFVNNVAKMSTKGLDSVRYIKGDLNIKAFGISSLIGLGKLDSIHGSLYVYGDGVSNFSDLKSIKYIGKNITVNDSEISSFSGLSKITEIKGNLRVSDNPLSFSGLQNLEIIHGNFEVVENGINGSFDGLTKLKEVKGNVYFYGIGKAEIKSLKALERIGGNLSLIRANLIQTPLQGMPALKLIGGDLLFNQNDELKDYGQWPALDTIHGSLRFYYHYSLSSLSGFNNLKYIGKNLKIELNKELVSVTGFNQLNQIKGSIEILNNVKLKTISALFNTQEVNGYHINSNPLITDLVFNNTNDVMTESVTIYSNNSLKSLSGLQSVKKIHNISINFNSKLTNVNFASQLNTLSGILLLENNSINEINVFSQLDSIKGGLTVSNLNNAGITIQEFLPTLTYFEGGLKLTQVTATDLPFLDGKSVINGQLILQNITSLNHINFLNNLDSVLGNFTLSLQVKSLQSLSSLQKINGSFAINNCDSIQTLKGLENLKFVRNAIYINFNDNLNSISQLQNIDTSYFRVFSSIPTLSLVNNPKLNECEIKLVCNLLTTGAKSLNIKNNGPECSSLELIDCLDNTMLSGKTYIDVNKNGILDNEDIIAPLIKLSINNGEKYIFSNQYGRYFFQAEPETKYVLKSENNDNLAIIGDSLSKTFFPQDEFKHEVHIGFKFLMDSIRGEVSIPGPKINRCSEIVQVNPKIVNIGTKPTNYRLRIFKGNYTLISSYPVPKYLIGAYEWEFNNVSVMSSAEISLNLDMPNFNSSGQDLIIPHVLYIQKNGLWILADSTAYISKIVCAYDPNDKQVVPYGKKEERFVLKDEPLSYTIRFQNTGTAAARDVIIRDTLDEGFDLSTFKTLGSSHKLHTELRGPYVEFYFRNIWLPDSLSNKEGSKGYVNFIVNAKEEIEECAKLENKADIYFDFNPPITTNTVSNTLVSYICDDTVIKIDTTVCTGESFFGYNKTGSYNLIYSKEKTCDTLIYLNLKVTPPKYKISQKQVCVGDTIMLNHSKLVMPSYSFYANDTIFDGNCLDSVYRYLLSPLYPSRLEIDTTICKGNDVYGYNQSGSYTIPILSQINQCKDTVELKLTVLPQDDPACITAVNELDNINLSLVPNPSSGNFEVVTLLGIHRIRIFNNLGQLVKEAFNNSEFYLADPGVYLIEILLSDYKFYNKKLIIKN
ncbi:MAG: hypothetical protein KA536_22625 [Saprospiraceae bacterium]|nr:hypothetical protein [Saprospiraceae bacterium]